MPKFLDFGLSSSIELSGIVAGANLSGDLKDPAAAIPKGTLGAIVLTYITYSYFAVQTGFIFLPKASGVKEEYKYQHKVNYSNPDIELAIKTISTANSELNFTRLPYIDECENDTNHKRDLLSSYFKDHGGDYYRMWNEGKGCEHGSALDQMTMTYVSLTGYLR